MKTSLPRLRLLAFAFPVVFSLLPGCASRSDLSVMALNNPAVTAKQTFVLVSGNSSEPDDGLFFQEMGEIIKAELATRGMYEAPSAAAADVTVRVEIRVEGPFIRLIETSVAHESTPRDSSLGTGSGHAVRYTDKTLATYYNKVLLTLTAMENPLPSEGLPTLVWKVEAAAEQKKPICGKSCPHSLSRPRATLAKRHREK